MFKHPWALTQDITYTVIMYLLSNTSICKLKHQLHERNGVLRAFRIVLDFNDADVQVTSCLVIECIHLKGKVP